MQTAFFSCCLLLCPLVFTLYIYRSSFGGYPLLASRPPPFPLCKALELTSCSSLWNFELSYRLLLYAPIMTPPIGGALLTDFFFTFCSHQACFETNQIELFKLSTFSVFSCWLFLTLFQIILFPHFSLCLVFGCCFLIFFLTSLTFGLF